MKSLTKLLITGAISLAALCIGQAAPAEVGKAAPDFTLTDINGQQRSLSEFKGKTVVLEWVNQECPFVVKHYDKSGNMPKTQQAAAKDGVVWLQINSGHAGAQGDFDAAKVADWQKRNAVAATAYFRDQDGKVGKLYDARTTPHMYVIDPAGTLVYAGGIDDIRSSKAEDIAKANNYVLAALSDLKSGQPVRTKNSQAYGCSVKYKN
jgi:hypothetical protein